MIDEKKLIEDIRRIGLYGSGYSDEEREENVIDIIESQTKVGGWIPCSERLPDTKTKPYQSVLLQVGNSIVVGYVNSAGQWFVDVGDGWSADLDGEPVAWQPLPEPYKEVGGFDV